MREKKLRQKKKTLQNVSNIAPFCISALFQKQKFSKGEGDTLLLEPSPKTAINHTLRPLYWKFLDMPLLSYIKRVNIKRALLALTHAFHDWEGSYMISYSFLFLFAGSFTYKYFLIMWLIHVHVAYGVLVEGCSDQAFPY